MSIEQGLAKTRGGFFARLFGRGESSLTAEWLDSLEEALLRADLSVSLVDPLMAQLRDLFATGELKTVPKALGAVLVSTDQDFAQIDGLTVEDWTL